MAQSTLGLDKEAEKTAGRNHPGGRIGADDEGKRSLALHADLLRLSIEARWEAGERLDAICRHALTRGGELLRSVLLIECGVAVGGPLHHVLPAAVGTESGHVSSLIHDDIVNGDETRPGRPSVVARHGLRDAIIAGDALLFSLFKCIAESRAAGVSAERVVRALDVVAAAGIDLCKGRALESEASADPHCTPERYYEVIGMKTASLFRGSCATGAILGGGSEAQIAVLTQYGQHLGMAFQLIDDLLPYTGDQARTGRPDTSDVRNKRVTLPVILARRDGSPAVWREIRSIMEHPMPGAQEYARLRRILEETGAIRQTLRAARGQALQAREVLETRFDAESRRALTGFAELALARNA